jgi:hypothetical protein
MPTPGGLHDTHTSVTISFAITSLEMNVIMQKKAGSEGRNFAAPQIGFYVDRSTASTMKVPPTSNTSGCDMMCDWSGILQPLPPKLIPRPILSIASLSCAKELRAKLMISK